MKPNTANMINGIILVVFSSWGYFASNSPSATAFIPAVFGVALLACNGGIKAENKIIAHVAVVLTLVVLLALIMPLRGTLSRGDTGATLRVIIMMASSALALAVFIRSFIEARRNRA